MANWRSLRHRLVCVIVYVAATASIFDRRHGSGGRARRPPVHRRVHRPLDSLRWTTAARATVFLFAAPFFVALGAVFVLKDERLRRIQWLGLTLAFLGVALGFAGRSPGGGPIGDALALMAAALWGATTLVIKATPLRRADPTKVSSIGSARPP